MWSRYFYYLWLFTDEEIETQRDGIKLSRITKLASGRHNIWNQSASEDHAMWNSLLVDNKDL